MPCKENRFRGSEDLGGGLKATFEMEKRFMVNDGTNNSAAGLDWEGASNIGLAGNWGRIRFGRVNELTTETIRKFDPFYQYGIGGMIESSLRSARISNTARYDSPKWSGFSFGLSYSLGDGTGTHDCYDGREWLGAYDASGNQVMKDITNDGYAINVSYDNGPFMATANWSRLADSADSYNWNIGLGYKFGAARVTLAYEQTRDKLGLSAGGGQPNAAQWGGNTQGSLDKNGDYVGYGSASKQQNWMLGLEWDIGPGQFDASVNYLTVDKYHGGYDFDGDNAFRYAIGYTYNLSKRTSVYGFLAYDDVDEKLVEGGMWDKESTFGVQIGMTHKF
jgi:predicted porin